MQASKSNTGHGKIFLRSISVIAKLSINWMSLLSLTSIRLFYPRVGVINSSFFKMYSVIDLFVFVCINTVDF